MVMSATGSDISGLEEVLQRALHFPYIWSYDNNMPVNTDKTTFQLFSLSTKHYDIQLRYDEKVLSRIFDTVYLGIHLDQTAFTKAVKSSSGKLSKNDPVDMNAVETAFEQLKLKVFRQPLKKQKGFEYLKCTGQEDVLISSLRPSALKAGSTEHRSQESKFVRYMTRLKPSYAPSNPGESPKKKYAVILFPMGESCLTAENLRAWESYVGYSSDESCKKDLDLLMKFLSIEVSSEDRIKTS
ncbi:hypothetical protein TNIN_436881 [Trichonephila inaurata madagascariensis]|uniref:Uncharacterized protein n=1 Tax=Trichonephila inaurata madagascariensis TaxID=2747483 RepID=A0A8X6YXC8_9ARAC|nr:hypothetical protein TNIN_436881 [Trichonephila inaurata madagascariensis]